MTPNDPLYGQQWHFDLMGDIETIWDEYDGSGVVVAVYDDGVDTDHPDLAGNYDASLHFRQFGTVYGNDPLTAQDAHGTACAGLIGAIDNGIGGVGVAHGVTLTGVNLLGDSRFWSGSTARDSFEYARNYDVMSNSWGYTPQYDAYQTLSDPTSQIARETAAMRVAVDQGRDGLGTVIVQAAGNDTLNANACGINAFHGSINVAALRSDGSVQSYSNYGANILVSAGAGSVTTDVAGSWGYSGGNYTTTFGGTSAATPIVAGVVALMLEANEALGWRDVQNVLAMSAAQTGSDVGAAPSGFEQGAWIENGGTTWNGGGATWHASYGYGAVDAFAAVRMAEAWSYFHDAAQTSANEDSASASWSGTLNVPDSGASLTLTETDNVSIEGIYVTVEMQHTWSSDVVITLVAPDGTEIVLMSGEGGSTLMDNGFEWTFAVEGLRLTDSAGDWTVVFDDTVNGDTGVVSSVEIEFFGAQYTTDDVHHFTQDLHDLVANDAARISVTDTNGGTDWLNFAAMGAGAITVDLGAGTVTFAGETTQLDLGLGQFEAVLTSDGNDVVTGDGGANTLVGMRGHDKLYGEGGNDELVGGTGADQLYGGAGNDRLLGGDGVDKLIGGSGIDMLSGDGGNDRLEGGTGNDRMFGGGNSDNMMGGDGDDMLNGAWGADRLVGGLGDDVLNGGTGRDTYIGGGGADTFVFAINHGIDRIKWMRADDTIDIARLNDIANWNDLVANHMTQVGADTVIDTGEGTITIVGMDMDDLTAANFIF